MLSENIEVSVMQRPLHAQIPLFLASIDKFNSITNESMEGKRFLLS